LRNAATTAPSSISGWDPVFLVPAIFVVIVSPPRRQQRQN
jgi:hypothetical protein